MRALLIGAGLALTAGFLMGSAMKPDLLAPPRPEGPQIFTEWSGESTGPFDPGVSLAAYKGGIPDYVIGTDTLRWITPPEPEFIEADDTEPVEMVAAEPVPQAGDDLSVVLHEAPAEPVIYPSLDGNVSYASDASSG